MPFLSCSGVAARTGRWATFAAQRSMSSARLRIRKSLMPTLLNVEVARVDCVRFGGKGQVVNFPPLPPDGHRLGKAQVDRSRTHAADSFTPSRLTTRQRQPTSANHGR